MKIKANKPMSASTFATDQPHSSYDELLQSKDWVLKREEILKRDNHHCVNCGSMITLQVHHRQYHIKKTLKEFKKPWEYKSKYLITLCLNCHLAGHNHFKIPIFNI